METKLRIGPGQIDQPYLPVKRLAPTGRFVTTTIAMIRRG